ncbi:MAG: PD-(D/E)XK nuclease family protein [Nibricoccus sp.]
MWTVSEAKLFRRCQKQWFYKHRFGAALATKVPARREAFVLGTFQTVEQWRGQLVDKVIEEVVVDALNKRRPLTLTELLAEADRLFDLQLAFARANRTRGVWHDENRRRHELRSSSGRGRGWRNFRG